MRRERGGLFWAALAVSATMAAACGKTDDRPYVWAYLSPVIFQPSCGSASCHSRGAAVSGLDFSTPERGYRSLTSLHVWVASASRAADGSCQQQGTGWLCPSPRPFVIPYVPAESRLLSMLRAHDAPRMPPDRPLPAPDIALIEAWILNGASETAGVGAPLIDASSPTGQDGAAEHSSPDAGDREQ